MRDGRAFAERVALIRQELGPSGPGSDGNAQAAQDPVEPVGGMSEEQGEEEAKEDDPCVDVKEVTKKGKKPTNAKKEPKTRKSSTKPDAGKETKREIKQGRGKGWGKGQGKAKTNSKNDKEAVSKCRAAKETKKMNKKRPRQ